MSLENRLGQACNEEAFQYFLTMERNRSRRSGRPFFLLLVRLKKQRGTAAGIDPAVAEKVFACLWLSLRATDQVGWFREGRSVGALLADVSETDLARSVCEKVRSSLHAGLPHDLVVRLDVRAFRLPRAGKI